jgi:hypothetical protein
MAGSNGDAVVGAINDDKLAKALSTLRSRLRLSASLPNMPGRGDAAPGQDDWTWVDDTIMLSYRSVRYELTVTGLL